MLQHNSFWCCWSERSACSKHSDSNVAKNTTSEFCFTEKQNLNQITTSILQYTCLQTQPYSGTYNTWGWFRKPMRCRIPLYCNKSCGGFPFEVMNFNSGQPITLQEKMTLANSTAIFHRAGWDHKNKCLRILFLSLSLFLNFFFLPLWMESCR